ncbi:MAG: PorV/PorQ family protein [Elusimicrobiota bacterium]
MKRNCLLLVTCYLLLVAMTGSIFAWEINTEEETGEAGGAAPYLKTGIGSRALAMGSAFTAVSDDASNVYWNPAGITYLEKKQVALTYTNMSLDRSYNFISFAMPQKVLMIDGLGVGIIHSGVKDIHGYDAKNYPTKTFSETNLALLVSIAKKIDDEIAVGGNLKLLQGTLDDGTAFGAGFDVSTLVSISDKLKLGIMLQDIYTMLSWKDSESIERVPFVVKTGLAYSLLKNNRLKLCADAEKFVTRKRIELNFGTELNLISNIALRTGLSDNFLAAGFGLNYNIISLDYCYCADKLKSGDTNQLTLMFAFGSVAKSAENEPASEPKVTDKEKQIGYIQVTVATADGVAPNATVKILQANKEIIKDITNENGEYISAELPAGKYTVKVWQRGYLSEEQKVKISSNKPAEVNFKLKKR